MFLKLTSVEVMLRGKLFPELFTNSLCPKKKQRVGEKISYYGYQLSN